ncbi:unnamed protein product [Dracunculus medinensis]|uniref:TIP120 domain-containing protein n=1 Tax=Dracunculus medinensis TaxID=318479 RepID=A0A0N4UMU4_DRAME|nr:unnamed protein product [Dracunculus medinensis]
MTSMAYKVTLLLEKMASADKDYRFMATNDLMNDIRNETLKLDDDSEKKVVNMMMKLMEDKNGEVQNLAVKCIGPLIVRVNELLVNFHILFR